jgi:hypothetical protein
LRKRRKSCQILEKEHVGSVDQIGSLEVSASSLAGTPPTKCGWVLLTFHDRSAVKGGYCHGEALRLVVAEPQSHLLPCAAHNFGYAEPPYTACCRVSDAFAAHGSQYEE